jgi:hypothetical protein
LAGQVDIVLEAAVAAEQALVLEAPYRLPDSELAHRAYSHRHPGEGRDPPCRETPMSLPGSAMMMPYWIGRASGKVDPGFRRDDKLWEASLSL